MVSTSFNKDTTAEEVAQALSENIKGKNVLLVGATVGSLGAEFLRVVAPYAKTVWVAGRSPERLQVAVDEALKGATESKPTINIVELDLTSTESVRAAAAKINAEEKPIDVILQGIMVKQSLEIVRTPEGFESQIAGNHFGTFLLTSLLLPRLRQAGPGARVVAVSSKSAWLTPIRWDDINFTLRPEEYVFHAAYAQSKLANVLFVQEFAKRFASEGILAYTLHPGVIATNGGKELPKDYLAKFGIYLADGTLNPDFPFKTIGQGTATYVVAAFDPSIKDQSGAFLDDCQISQAPPTATEENAARLWALSEELLGIKFAEPSK